MLGGKIAIVATVIIAMLLGAIGYMDYKNDGLNKEIGGLSVTLAVEKAVREEQEKNALAIAALNEGHYEAQAKLTGEYNAEREKNIKLSINAERDALANPLKFMDDLASDFIYYDCLRNLGSSILSADRSQACRAEADRTDPTSAGLSGTAITPDFREAWTEACDARITIGKDYTHEEWEEEYPGFDLEMCSLTVAALTPDAVSELRRAFSASVSDIRALWVLIKSQQDIITQLTADKTVTDG